MYEYCFKLFVKVFKLLFKKLFKLIVSKFVHFRKGAVRMKI